MGKRTEENGMAAPTKKQVKRDINALMKRKKDSEVIIKNVKPKLTGGKHELVDETFSDTAKFLESEEGEIKE